MPESSVQLMRCEKGMGMFPNKFFDIAIVDPPIGKGRTSGVGQSGRLRQFGKKQKWDDRPPGIGYFKELFRVSKAQVIWCGNYYKLPPSPGWLIWDKGEGFYNRTFAECELAWTSFQRPAKKFLYDPLAGGDYKNKINPCQKPVPLYDWIIAECCQPGFKILDTHVGSGSSRIAAWHAGFDYWGFEADKEHFLDQEARFNIARTEIKMFAQPAIIHPVQLTL